MLYPFLGALWSITDSWGQKRGLLQSFGHDGSDRILLYPVEGATASGSEKSPGWDRMLFCLGSKAALLCHIHSRWYDYTFLSVDHRHIITQNFGALCVVLYVFYLLFVYTYWRRCMYTRIPKHVYGGQEKTVESHFYFQRSNWIHAFCRSFFFL